MVRSGSLEPNYYIEFLPIELFLLANCYFGYLTYPIVLHPDPNGGYVAEIKDLPGCLTQGETIEETLKNIDKARELWLETVFELDRSIPLPSDNIPIKWVLVSASLNHRWLSEAETKTKRIFMARNLSLFSIDYLLRADYANLLIEARISGI